MYAATVQEIKDALFEIAHQLEYHGDEYRTEIKQLVETFKESPTIQGTLHAAKKLMVVGVEQKDDNIGFAILEIALLSLVAFGYALRDEIGNESHDTAEPGQTTLDSIQSN